MVDANEWEWVRQHSVDSSQPINHLLLASTLPFLLAPGLHHLEGWDEAISSGAWGPRGAAVGERVRQGMDLEHWGSFRKSFDDVTDLLGDLVRADEPPASVLMLSGDVPLLSAATLQRLVERHVETGAAATVLTAVIAPKGGRPIRPSSMA